MIPARRPILHQQLAPSSHRQQPWTTLHQLNFSRSAQRQPYAQHWSENVSTSARPPSSLRRLRDRERRRDLQSAWSGSIEERLKLLWTASIKRTGMVFAFYKIVPASRNARRVQSPQHVVQSQSRAPSYAPRLAIRLDCVRGGASPRPSSQKTMRSPDTFRTLCKAESGASSVFTQCRPHGALLSSFPSSRSDVRSWSTSQAKHDHSADATAQGVLLRPASRRHLG